MVEPIGPIQPSIPSEAVSDVNIRAIAKDLNTKLTEFIVMLNQLDESSTKDPTKVAAFGNGIESLHESAKAAVGGCADCVR